MFNHCRRFTDNEDMTGKDSIKNIISTAVYDRVKTILTYIS